VEVGLEMVVVEREKAVAAEEVVKAMEVVEGRGKGEEGEGQEARCRAVASHVGL
jgi:hypothetical protein